MCLSEGIGLLKRQCFLYVVVVAVFAIDAIYMTSGSRQSMIISGCLWSAECQVEAQSLRLQHNSSQAIRLCIYCNMIYAGLHSGY